MYLTKELKDYYLSDFQKLLNYDKSDFWDIDEGIKESLRLINANRNIQSLYSKKFACNDDSISLDTTSYLEITFTKNIESKLLTILEEIKDSLTSENSVLTINKRDPRDNANYSPESRIQLGCVTNPDYFRVTHLLIEIDSNTPNNHDLFWSVLTSKLPMLTE